MMTEKRKKMIRKTLLPAINNASGESGRPRRARSRFSSGGVRESTSIAAVAASQLAEYSTRMCARRTENSTMPSITMLNAVVTFRSRSILPSGLGLAGTAMQPAIEFQNVHENSEEDVKDVIQRFHCSNGRAAGQAGTHRAGDFDEAEAAALQHNQRLDFRIFEWKAFAEDAEGLPVHADEAGSRVKHGPAEDRAQHQPEEADAQPANPAGMPVVAVEIAGADYHFTSGIAQFVEDGADIAGVVLAVAIDANHVLKSQLKGEFISGLDASTQAEMMGQRQDLGAGGPRPRDGIVARAIVNYEHGNAGAVLMNGANDARDRSLLVESGNNDEQRIGAAGAHQSLAILRALSEWPATSRRKTRGVMRAPARMRRRSRHKRGA